MAQAQPGGTSEEEALAFEVATRDLVGLALRSVADLQMSLPQIRLLMVLGEHGPTSSSKCAQALGVAASSVTRLADRLHDSGHLTRRADTSRRSVVVLELTAAGRRAVEEVTSRRRQELRLALDQLEPADRSRCAAILQHLHDLLGDTGAEPYRLQLPL